MSDCICESMYPYPCPVHDRDMCELLEAANSAVSHFEGICDTRKDGPVLDRLRQAIEKVDRPK